MKQLFNSLFAIGLTLLLAGACSKEQEVFSGSQLGVEQTDYEVEADQTSKILVKVLADSPYTVSGMNDVSWLKIQHHSQGDAGFYVKCTRNEGVPRMARLLLTCDADPSHRDTVRIKQKGVIVPTLSMDGAGLTVDGTASTASKELETNVEPSEFDIKITYPVGQTPWVESAAIVRNEAGKVVLQCACSANPSATLLRKAVAEISFVDGWNQVTSYNCYLTQKTSNGQQGRAVTFQQLRDMGTTAGVTLQEDLLITGYVVSNPDSGNMGDNEQTSPATIDYSVSRRTIYFQSEDGSLGLRITTKTDEDNTLARYDKAVLDLRGAKLFKSNVYDASKVPVFYYIEDFTASMVVSVTPSSATAIPTKTRAIGSLTDADIFTYVTIPNCELPFRKGSMTPINEGYANAGLANRCAKFPILLRDNQGNTMYIYTNTTCLYRRDGKRLPYGQGTMSGVIVHEPYTRFEYEDNNTGDEDTYGWIGKYQIRHTSYDDFSFAETMEGSSFSALIAEWRYVDNDFLKNGAAPTAGSDGNALLTQTYTYPSSHSQYGNTCFYRAVDFSYLGPVGTDESSIFGKHGGNENGLGIILANGEDWMGPDYAGLYCERRTTINNNSPHQGKGQVPREVGSAWEFWYNRDGATSEMQNIVVSFSTTGISTSHLSVQYAMVNYSSGSNAESHRTEFGPRYWYLEYSLTDATGKASSGWTQLKRFSVPDMVLWSPTTQLWQCPGFKQMSTELPTSLCGKSKVYLRFRPDPNYQGTTTQYAVAPEVGSTMAWTAMDYLAIRYSK